MGGLTIACVRTGTKYAPEYVSRLRNMVARHLRVEHRFVCLTDQPEHIDGVETVDTHGLTGWWAKMALFDPAIRGDGKCIFFDLDTVIIDNLTPLADIEADFAICANFTRVAGNLAWPCRYGSCCMVFRDGFGSEVWQRFDNEREYLMRQAGRYGDQRIIEWLCPDATILQDVLPYRFFLGYRGLPEHREASPKGCSVVVFAGSHKPDNCEVKWVKQAWR